MVQKFYKITNQKYNDELNNRVKINKEQAKFINKIFNEYGIDGDLYNLCGSGRVGVPFNESEKKEITLWIKNTGNNRNKFNGHFKKKQIDGMLIFKKTSNVLKEIQDRCIKENVIVNLPFLRVGDYFKEFKYLEYTYEQFRMNDVIYLMIESVNVTNITPEYDGFEEIKGSEFYIKKEEYQK